MQLMGSPYKSGRRLLIVPMIVFAAALALLWKPLLQVLALAAGSGALAFLLHPLAQALEKRLSRPVATLAALLLVFTAIGTLLWFLLPSLAAQAIQLGEALPRSLGTVSAWMDAIGRWFASHVPGIALPSFNLEGFSGMLPDIATGTLNFAGSAASALSGLSLAVMLAYFWLCDRDNLLLRMELLVPQVWRGTAVRMGGAVARELRLYLQGQLLVAAAVGALSAVGMLLVGVRSALVLGALVGLLNMVPYFGPFIGGVPAVLIALGDGWQRAAMCLGVLMIVQQIDNGVISPRVMGSLTGFSPASVLVAIFAGARLGGIVGMLIALPVLMSIRTVFRVFVQRYENI